MSLSFSIITPSFNQAQFLKFCLNSVNSQGHRVLEHIVLDPGSEDNSRAIAAESPNITLVAEPDSGQCDAINKGFIRAKGDVLAWLNSDDLYHSDDILESVAKRFQEPDQPDVVYGKAIFVDEDGKFLRDAFINQNPSTIIATLQHQVGIIQPSVFIKKEVFESVGGLDTTFEYALDYEYWARIAVSGFKWGYIDKVLSRHRWWSKMKTASDRDKSLMEHCRVGLKHFGYAHWLWIHRLADCVVGGVDGIIKTNTNYVNPLERARKIATYYIQYNAGEEIARKLFAEKVNNSHVRETILDMENHGVEIRFDETASWEMKLSDNELPTTWRSHSSINSSGKEIIGYAFSKELSFSIRKKSFNGQLERSKKFFAEEKNNRSRDTCVVVGNGPSLNKSSLNELNECDLIISNFAYYNEALLLKAKYLTIVNDLVMRQAAYDLPQLRSVDKIFPIWLRKHTIDQSNTYYLNAHLKPEFSEDVTKWISWRSTVSFFNLQLAASLGYKKILMIGFDHSYIQPSHVKEGDLIEQETDDKNHFMPNYFKGKTWQAADTDNMEKVYELARDVANARRIEIVNCTVGGKLEVFRRGLLKDEII